MEYFVGIVLARAAAQVPLAEFLEPHGLSQFRLAKDIRVPARRVNEIVPGKRGITADTALRLSRYLGTSERFWLNLQVWFELESERDRTGARIAHEVPVVSDGRPRPATLSDQTTLRLRRRQPSHPSSRA